MSFDTETLWDSFREGNIFAMESMYRQYYQTLYNYGWQICRNSELTRDAIHNLFMDLWRRREHLRSTSNLKFYLFKALRRQLVHILEREKKNTSINDMLSSMIDAELSEVEVSELQLQQALALKQAVQNLSKRQKEVIFLRYYENLSCEEIAEVMEININTVYNNVSLAIKKLKDQFEDNPLLLILLSIIKLNGL
jgi:RNA polymerase sigma-70 factor (ECF subfamily)